MYKKAGNNAFSNQKEAIINSKYNSVIRDCFYIFFTKKETKKTITFSLKTLNSCFNIWFDKKREDNKELSLDKIIIKNNESFNSFLITNHK